MTRDLESRTFIRNLLNQQGYLVLEAANDDHAEIVSPQLQVKIDPIVTDAAPSQIAVIGEN